MSKNKQTGPKVLLIDIETMPMLASVWGLWDNNVPLNMIERDWSILSFAAKWLGSPESEVMYMDQRNIKDIQDDSKLLKKIWELLDECDIVIGQNSNKFDLKKINARFIMHGMKPPSSYKKIDTLVIAKKHFAFTSNKLEYMTAKLCNKYKKLVDKKFPGFLLWQQCMKGNIKAWQEMKSYNILDVLSLEELYLKMAPWDNSVNFNLFKDGETSTCNCGSEEIIKRGFSYTVAGKYQRFVCKQCGTWSRSNVNLFSKEKKVSLRRNDK